MGTNRGNAKSILRFLVIIVAAFFILSLSLPLLSYAEESSCISCHTSLKKLIQEIRVIEASKPKVEASTESEGEG
ncbi:MAG: hypothetical protein JXQ25_08865 [Deltaproteobacteria bacterium]|nr:hypothetical protein [Deltaproteobacteria bacterium]